MDDKKRRKAVILNILEDGLELSNETKKHLALAKKDIAEGRVYTHDQVKKELGLK